MIIRECTDKYVVVRSDTYASNLAHFDSLFDLAKQDFPDLEREEVRVVMYGGKRYKGTFGLEFDLPDGFQPPTHYTRIPELEFTL